MARRARLGPSDARRDAPARRSTAATSTRCRTSSSISPGSSAAREAESASAYAQRAYEACGRDRPGERAAVRADDQGPRRRASRPGRARRARQPTRGCRSRSVSGSFPPTSSCARRAASSSCRSRATRRPSVPRTASRGVAEAGFGEPALFRFHGDAIEALLRSASSTRRRRCSPSSRKQVEALERRLGAYDRSRCRGLLSGRGRGPPGPRMRASSARSSSTSASVSRSSARERTWSWDDPSAESGEAGGPRIAEAALNGLRAARCAALGRAGPGRAGADRGRAPAADALTPTEQRVAELVAAGGTYREVADALFISPKTVQWNLSKIYRKLGIRSRAQLAAEPRRRPGDESTPAEPPVAL